MHISIFGGIISHCSSSKCSVFCLFVFCEALLFPTYAQDPFGDNFYVPFRKATQVLFKGGGDFFSSSNTDTEEVHFWKEDEDSRLHFRLFVLTNKNLSLKKVSFIYLFFFLFYHL